MEGVLSIRIYTKEHDISSLLEASGKISKSFDHFISFPLSYRQMTSNFSSNNIQQQEHYFNIYEVNRRLSTINPTIIKERKREYDFIYQVRLYY